MTVSLVVPGSSEKMLGKAATLEADEIVLDLEDAVAPTLKETARGRVVSALARLDRQVAVRVNAVGNRWVVDDVVALARCSTPPASLVLPKVESRDDVVFLDTLLRSLGRDMRLQLLIETARGIRQLDAILTGSTPASPPPRPRR